MDGTISRVVNVLSLFAGSASVVPAASEIVPLPVIFLPAFTCKVAVSVT